MFHKESLTAASDRIALSLEEEMQSARQANGHGLQTHHIATAPVNMHCKPVAMHCKWTCNCTSGQGPDSFSGRSIADPPG